MTELAQIARSIFTDTLKSLDLSQHIAAQIAVHPDALALAGTSIPFAEIDSIITIAIGKAAAAMYSAVDRILEAAPALQRRGIVVAPAQHKMGWPNTEFFPGGHPIPDANSLNAAEAALAMLAAATPRTVVIFLVSGGASAMIEKPLDDSISLHDLASFYDALVGSGLSIARMNALRKHISAVKGGRLAEAASGARFQLTLLVSDVPASTPDAIGSGPSLPDTTTLADCRQILKSLDPGVSFPTSIRDFLTSSACPETPRTDADVFARSRWRTILSSEDMAQSAATHARSASFHVEIDNHCDEWEYRDAAAYLLDRSAALAEVHPRCCLISVGEIAVALSAHPGIGGRNGHFALWCAQEALRRDEDVTILSAGSDGIDGNSTTAGAVCDRHASEQARKLGLSVDDALLHFNTAPLLDAIGASVTSGPTGNNLRDLRLLLRSS